MHMVKPMFSRRFWTLTAKELLRFLRLKWFTINWGFAIPASILEVYLYSGQLLTQPITKWMAGDWLIFSNIFKTYFKGIGSNVILPSRTLEILLCFYASLVANKTFLPKMGLWFCLFTITAIAAYGKFSLRVLRTDTTVKPRRSSDEPVRLCLG